MAMILGHGALLCLATGCAGPASRPQPATPAVAAPAAAAASGGAAWASGTQAKNEQRRTALAAGSAVLTADTVGYYMDVQEARLREQLAGSGAQVTRLGDDLKVSLPGAGMFAADRAELDPRFHSTLDSICAVLQKFDKTVVEIAGHSDSGGSAEHNHALSERRAAAVAGYLQGRGVARTRIAMVGVGESQPVASNATADGRARNRRVELILSPLLKGG
jgi:outer membrane protein OmpA-like peptidoglycan-associated protein